MPVNHPDYPTAFLQTIREPMLVLDDTLRVVMSNRAFHRTFGSTPADTEGRLIYELGDGQWNISALKELLERHLHENHHYDDFEITQDFSGLGQRTLLLNARRLVSDGGKTQLILLAIEDVSGRRGDKESRDNPALADGRDRYQTLLESIDEGFCIIEMLRGSDGHWNDYRFLETEVAR